MNKIVIIFFAISLSAVTGLAQSPEVLFTSPSQNQLNVPAGSTIIVTFDTDMDDATINSNTFCVVFAIRV